MLCFGWNEKQGWKMKKKNMISCCSVGVKRERNENWVVGVFHLEDPLFLFFIFYFYFPSQLGIKIKWERIALIRRPLQNFSSSAQFYIISA